MRSHFILPTLLFAAVLGGSSCGRCSITPTELTTEYKSDAFTDVTGPRFAWINKSNRNGAQQTAYEIRVSKSADFSSTLWESGPKANGRSAFITYTGPAPESCTDYWWQVRVRDEKGRESKWSTPCHFHTGVLIPSLWEAQWIGAPWQAEDSYDYHRREDVDPAPILRKEFEITKPVKSARFYGTGLGYFELYLNGERVSDEYFVPNETNYDYREKLGERLIPVEDPFNEYTVMYLSYDLTDKIQQGCNAVGAILGNGFYDLVFRRFVMGYGTPRFFGQILIKYEDGSREVIASDTTWKIEKSAIIYDQMYRGEHYDARLEHDGWASAGYDDTGWTNAVVKKTPVGKMVAQLGPSDRITARFQPVSITRDSVIRVKFPEEISGWVELRDLNLKEGQQIELTYLNESLVCNSIYTAKGSGNESFHPRFKWFVFSEVEIKGLDSLEPSQIEAQAVNSDVTDASHFETSNELLNTIDKIWRRSMYDNMHGGVPSDCPHRERIGYTGDGESVCPTVMNNLTAETFYNKWIRDLRGAQIADGYVANSAPWQPEAGGGIGFGAAMEFVPLYFYNHYGDIRVLQECFEAMQAHVRWMTTWVDPATKIMESRSGHYFKDLGEWVPATGLPSNALVHTFFLWSCSNKVVEAAKALGKPDVAAEFSALRDTTAAAFHRTFYDPETGSYGKHGSNVFALVMGVPEDREAKVVEALVSNIHERDDHLDTGFFGIRYLFEVLVKHGQLELAYKIINQRTQPSFGWWIDQGATTTWEQWDGNLSHNHPFMGGGILWFYQDLAGVEATSPGFRTFEIRPEIPEGLTWVNYDKKTTYGTIAVSWKVSGSKFSLSCEVPVGTTATVYIPDGENPRKEYTVGSGRHTFKGTI
ncbi:MAG: family 78 glycoside hydrolase catalytic domain [Bacteroidales bacterium]|nr:family 78 glycoside hydrolase catalytic domain [Bacteroidales bacterium]